MCVYMIKLWIWIILGILIWMGTQLLGFLQESFQGHQAFVEDPTPIHVPQIPSQLIPSKSQEIRDLENSLERIWTLATPKTHSATNCRQLIQENHHHDFLIKNLPTLSLREYANLTTRVAYRLNQSAEHMAEIIYDALNECLDNPPDARFR